MTSETDSDAPLMKPKPKAARGRPRKIALSDCPPPVPLSLPGTTTTPSPAATPRPTPRASVRNTSNPVKHPTPVATETKPNYALFATPNGDLSSRRRRHPAHLTSTPLIKVENVDLDSPKHNVGSIAFLLYQY